MSHISVTPVNTLGVSKKAKVVWGGDVLIRYGSHYCDHSCGRYLIPYKCRSYTQRKAWTSEATPQRLRSLLPFGVHMTRIASRIPSQSQHVKRSIIDSKHHRAKILIMTSTLPRISSKPAVFPMLWTVDKLVRMSTIHQYRNKSLLQDKTIMQTYTISCNAVASI